MITSPTTPRRFTKKHLFLVFYSPSNFISYFPLLYVILVPGKDGKFPFQTAVDVDVGNAVDVDVGNDVYVGDDVDVDVDVGDKVDVDVGGAQELAGYLAIWTERLTGTGWAPLRAKMLTDAHQPHQIWFIVNKRKMFFFLAFYLYLH